MDYYKSVLNSVRNEGWICDSDDHEYAVSPKRHPNGVGLYSKFQLGTCHTHGRFMHGFVSIYLLEQ